MWFRGSLTSQEAPGSAGGASPASDPTGPGSMLLFVSSEDLSPSTNLLYPFYLDEDMSMAFSAALAGGVATEVEQTDRAEDTSKAVRSLRGSLKLFGAANLEGGKERDSSSAMTRESTLLRRHTAHSIFINLHQELQASGRLSVNPDFDDLRVGALVSMSLRPAIAPLRRVIDQVLRLLDVMAPILGVDAVEEHPASMSRQERRQRARNAATNALGSSDDDSGIESLRTLRNLFVSLRDDLEHSGMIDVVVASDDAPGVVLTLDKRFTDSAALELLHTSNFTLVGKVTRLWPEADDVVNLYRRSVLALVPALSQQVAVGVFTLLVTMAKAIGPVDLEQQVAEALGRPAAASVGADNDGVDDPTNAESGSEEGREQPDDDDIRVGDDIVALHPALLGRAVQVLPLALCV